jgi:acyl carrier protein
MMEPFYTQLAEILDVDSVQPADELRKFETWDSLSALSVIAMIDADFGVNLTAGDLMPIVTVGQLANLVQSKKMAACA